MKLLETIADPEIEPANLSTMTNRDLIGIDVVVAGWGRTNTQRLAIIMETAMLKIISKSECLKKVKKISQTKTDMIVPPTVLCSIAKPYTLLDNGESGGPLLDTNNHVVGVNEGTTPQTDKPFDPNEVNIHANINYYRHFIMDTISN
ncbi:PREDICTED: uncharacterized protein LOC105362248 isoform X2 [Ceratosolen solmsi marchali]|uniref:Uncharacterized protein LOC105362248 isoform X2 n=1 Tax=Ceratosolen solmsi marchali TaxID=326594 RepID=A0AAJ7DVH8_9HYME|nr:PREDICTED: uncharacterized protein LOC105362248 isoform X2 [Ceratosolen solmsi marchali]